MKNIDFHQWFIWDDMIDELDDMNRSEARFGTYKIFWPATAGCRPL